jgi:asparagine synthase (glutamine-hydrolysing)
MFAFAIWDERNKELFAARDRFGEKPFHYFWDSARGLFAFASEIKALMAIPEIECDIDERALYRFVAYQELAGSEQTLWKGIKRLPHSHWLKLKWRGDGFELTKRRYWDIDLERIEKVTLKDAGLKFAELFADSVRLRLRSDVPVGSSLSGGLDSSAVVCQIHALGAAGGQKTFSARMEDRSLDEGQYIAAVLAQTGVEGHEVWPTSEELERCFSKLCYHLEEPFIQTSQFAQHLVMRLAKENGVTVLLDGQGADELLAGYTPYFITRYSDMAESREFSGLWRERRGFRGRHNRPFPLSTKMLAARLVPDAYHFFRRTNGLREITTTWTEMTGWWNDEWLNQFAVEDPPELPTSSRDRLTKRLYSDTMMGELQELLRYGDRNSMAFSREVRQPFLDHRLAELVFALPIEYKLLNGETKVVFREAIKNLIPQSILRRQEKLGYQAPLPSWLRDPLKGWAEERLDRSPAQLSSYLTTQAVQKFRSMSAKLDESEARSVFSVLTLCETLGRMKQLSRTLLVESSEFLG